jgi:hypothetical protein
MNRECNDCCSIADIPALQPVIARSYVESELSIIVGNGSVLSFLHLHRRKDERFPCRSIEDNSAHFAGLSMNI